MQDRVIMENILQTSKGTCDLMMHGAIESATPEIHSAFTIAFNETLTMQNAIYNQMADMGWYPAQEAEQKCISQAKQKFSH